MSLRYEQQESNGIGAAVAQQVLSVTEPILQESASQQRVIVRTISEEVSFYYYYITAESPIVDTLNKAHNKI